MALKASNVQFSGAIPGGHGSGSFEVVVDNAYITPPKVLSEGNWVTIYDESHELFEGEILSIKPNVDESGVHKLMVDVGGMMAVADKRADVVQRWVHRGGADWKRRAWATDVGQLSFDGGANLGVIDMRIPSGSTADFNAGTMSNQLSCAFYLGDLVTDESINYVDYAGTCQLGADSNGATFTLIVYTAPDLQNYTPLQSVVAPTTTIANAVAVPAGTKQMLCILQCSQTAHAISGTDRFANFTKFDIYCSGRTTKPRIDEAMVDLATRPGIAFSAVSQPVGQMMDDLSVGTSTGRVTVAAGLQDLAALNAQPFDWGFWDNRAFFCRPRLVNPFNDSQVIVVGPDKPGLVSWDVADYDEDVPDYACVIFGNKDSAAFPEGWPRRIFRPTPPPDDNVKLETLDYSGTILSDYAAWGIGDNLVGRSPAVIPPGPVFRFHPERARSGLWPGSTASESFTALPTEISDNRAVAAGSNNMTWQGTNTPADPSSLWLSGSSSYVNWGNLAQLNLGTGPRTVSAWVKFGSVTGTQCIFSKRGVGTTQTGWGLYWLAGTGFYFAVSNNAGTGAYRAVSWQGGAWVPDTSTWYHVVGVYDGNECYGYISGAVATPTYIGTAGAYNSDCTNNAALGCLDPGGSPTCYMTGNINDVAVYKRALSASEVAQLYNAGTCLYERSAMKGSVVIEGEVMNRKGATVPATHVRAGWWIQHTELAVKPIYISGHAVSMADKRNALTLGTDWMEEQIGVREAELLAIAPTPTTDPTDPTDPKKVWPGPYTPPPPPTPTPAPAPAPGPAPAPAHPTHRVYKGQLQVWKNGKWHNVGKGKPSSSDHARG